MEQPTETEDRVWIPYEEVKSYLLSLNSTLVDMSASINTALKMIEENTSSIKD